MINVVLVMNLCKSDVTLITIYYENGEKSIA